MIDLFNVASSGLMAQNQLLNSTGNNIANVNTEGYVRTRTSHVEQELGGVGRSSTSRVIDIFAQEQHRRDVTQLGFYETYTAKVQQVDNIFANEANSIASSMSRFFSSLQTATDEPTNIAARQLVLGQAESMVGQMATMDNFLSDKQEEVNEQLLSTMNRANELIGNISELNNQIRITQHSNQFDEPTTLLNQLDQSILELSELVSINTRSNGDGTTLVNLDTGQSLVLEDGTFNLFELAGDPDINRQDLTLTTPDGDVNMPITGSIVGGEIGALFAFRDDILEPSRRELGQIALSLTDAMNQQNRFGMDLDSQLGGNIFSLPEFQSLNYADNSAANLLVNARVEEGEFSNLTSADYQITIDAVNAGPTLDITVALLNPDGSAVTDTSGTPVTQTLTGVTAGAGTFSSINGGLELEFPDGGAYAVGDQFLIQPTKGAAANIEVEMTRPEDLALAIPLRVEADINNRGDTSFTNITVTDPTADPVGPLLTAAGATPLRAEIVFTSANSYDVVDATGTTVVSVAGAPNLDNLIAQASAVAGWPFGTVPYDFSIEGTPEAGDTFQINYNTNGTDDNRNGLLMADLQNADTMVSDDGSGSSNLISFHEAYSTLVGTVGEKSASADISLKAAEAIERQSKELFQSTAGVNLDEEASNLIRFQQAYSASARVLTTAQSLFETILGAVR